MGNVNMEASQIHYRGGEKPMSVEEAIKEAGSSYVLPVASAETLGGVKVGDNLSIDDGVLSAPAYVLPTASDETLGGVKVGNNLSIAGGVLSAPAPYTPPAYSTTEQATGQKWIDGKDIYFITIDCGDLPNSNYIELPTPSNIDKVIHVSGFAYSTAQTGNFRPLPFVGGGTNDIRFDMSSGVFRLQTYTTWLDYKAYIIAYYTKTV